MNDRVREHLPPARCVLQLTPLLAAAALALVLPLSAEAGNIAQPDWGAPVARLFLDHQSGSLAEVGGFDVIGQSADVGNLRLDSSRPAPPGTEAAIFAYASQAATFAAAAAVVQGFENASPSALNGAVAVLSAPGHTASASSVSVGGAAQVQASGVAQVQAPGGGPAPTPEPSTLLLMGTALAGLYRARRRMQ